MKKYTLFIFGISFLILNIFSLKNISAYSTQLTPSPNPVVNGISDSLSKLIQNTFRDLSADRSINIGTSIPISPVNETLGSKLSELFSVKSISGWDLWGAIKAVLMLSINLFFIVINVVLEVLKGLLGGIK